MSGELILMQSEIKQVCPRCGIKQIEINKVIRYQPSVGNHLSPDQTYSRICQHAKGDGCINSSKTVLKSETLEGMNIPFSPKLDYTKMAKEILSDLKKN